MREKITFECNKPTTSKMETVQPTSANNAQVQREKIIAVLKEQYQMKEQWLRQFNNDDLKEMLDDLLIKKSKKG